mmetsp:Transcript_45449/g.110507  ORF Transcript_45449/g.110507 Transcript_45449/m.110507 type:complete len:301 (+) Transcript_45449:1949-2851(+)
MGLRDPLTSGEFVQLPNDCTGIVLASSLGVTAMRDFHHPGPQGFQPRQVRIFAALFEFPEEERIGWRFRGRYRCDWDIRSSRRAWCFLGGHMRLFGDRLAVRTDFWSILAAGLAIHTLLDGPVLIVSQRRFFSRWGGTIPVLRGCLRRCGGGVCFSRWCCCTSRTRGCLPPLHHLRMHLLLHHCPLLMLHRQHWIRHHHTRHHTRRHRRHSRCRCRFSILGTSSVLPPESTLSLEFGKVEPPLVTVVKRNEMETVDMGLPVVRVVIFPVFLGPRFPWLVLVVLLLFLLRQGGRCCSSRGL